MLKSSLLSLVLKLHFNSHILHRFHFIFFTLIKIFNDYRHTKNFLRTNSIKKLTKKKNFFSNTITKNFRFQRKTFFSQCVTEMKFIIQFPTFFYFIDTVIHIYILTEKYYYFYGYANICTANMKSVWKKCWETIKNCSKKWEKSLQRKSI